MRLRYVSPLLLVSLFMPALCFAQADRESPDDPDRVKALTARWRERKTGEDTAPSDEVNTIRVKIGQLIKLKADSLGEVAWDIPEELAPADEYYEDTAKRTVILPSARPGTYRVSAWGHSKAGPTLVPLPLVPTLGAPPTQLSFLALPSKPTRIKTWTIVIGDGGPPKPDDGVLSPTLGTIGEAVKADVKADPSARDQANKLAREFERLADEVRDRREWRQARDVRSAVEEMVRTTAGDRLPRTRSAIDSKLEKDRRIRYQPALRLLPGMRDQFRTVLREIAQELANAPK